MMINKLIKLYKNKKIPWDDINIIGMRNKENMGKDQFNDIFIVANNDEYIIAEGTTDPSVYWTKNPITHKGIKGAAHLCLGFYRGIWIVGTHAQGTTFAHEALLQIGNQVKIWRDTNMDFKNPGGEPIQLGYFGINFHRASLKMDADFIGKYSAGCQVIRKANDFKKIMEMIKSSKKFLENKKAQFNYLLIDKVNAGGLL